MGGCRWWWCTGGWSVDGKEWVAFGVGVLVQVDHGEVGVGEVVEVGRFLEVGVDEVGQEVRVLGSLWFFWLVWVNQLPSLGAGMWDVPVKGGDECDKLGVLVDQELGEHPI